MFFDVKLNSIKIKKNRDIGKAEIKIFSFITSSNYNLGLFNKVLESEDKNAQIELLKTATNDILSFKEIIKVDHIKDNSIIQFGMNGYSVYKSSEIPESFDWTLAIIDSDEEIRRIGKFIDNFVNHEGFDSFLGNILKLATTAAAPQIVMATELTKFVGKVVSAELMKNQDDQVGVYIESFNKYEHYVGPSYKGIEIDDLSSNCKISYSIFAKRD